MQRALDTSMVFASNVPGAHGCLTSQYGWPTRSWYLPKGQCSQRSALLLLLNLPVGHVLHVRSEVVLGGAISLSPATHTMCERQKALPFCG